MEKTVTISMGEYEEIKHKAELLEEIMEEDNLPIEELEKIRKAEISGHMTEQEFYSRHPELKG